MFKNIALISIFFFCTAASASQVQITTDNLTDAQVEQLKANAAQISAANVHEKENGGLGSLTSDPAKLLSNASTWGTQLAAASKGFAEALGIAAHELNINVNEFLSTPAGKLTAAMIIWKVAGSALVHIVIGIFFIIAVIIFARVMYLRLFTKEFQSYESSWLWGMYKTTRQRRIMKSIYDLNGDADWMVFWIIIISLGAGLGISAAIIINAV